MVLSNNSGSRLATDSWGIGPHWCATEAMPSIYLVAAWPPGTQGQTVVADVNVMLLKNESIKSVLVCTEEKKWKY